MESIIQLNKLSLLTAIGCNLKCEYCALDKSLNPIVGNLMQNTIESLDYLPFCSKRCKLIDLGAWANEEYVISTPMESPLENTTECLDSTLKENHNDNNLVKNKQ